MAAERPVTSTVGARFIVMPRASCCRPRSSPSARTCSGVRVRAIARALGSSPSRVSMRWTRPPSSSTATASGMRDMAWTPRSAWSVSSAVALPPMKIPPTWVARTFSAVVRGFAASTPTMSRWASLSRGDSAATTSAQRGSRSGPRCSPVSGGGGGAGAAAAGAPATTSPARRPTATASDLRNVIPAHPPLRRSVVCAGPSGSTDRRHPLVLGRRAGRGAVAERPPAQLLAPVPGEPAARVGAEGDDSGRVDLLLQPVVVLLDLLEVDRVAEAGGLEQVARVGPQHRHLGELLPVALEVTVVDGVEPHERDPQPDVGLGDGVPDEVAAGGEPLGQRVEAREERPVGLLVGGLAPREAALVHAVVDVVVDDLVDLVDLGPVLLRVQVGGALAVVGAPLGLEVEGELLEVVGQRLAGGDLDDGRDGHPAVVVRVGGLVGLAQVLDAED